MDNKQQKVDQLFSEWAKASSPGCSISIMQDGEFVYQQGYGMANLEYNIPIVPKTIFHVASVSKQFTAMAIALLADSNQLSLDDDVRQYLTELPDFGETITLRHMLHHTSGLRDQWELLILAGWRMDDVITTDDILELVEKQERLNFNPGDGFLYSNMGYTLLGCVVKRVSGKSLHDFCDEHIFKPLEMHHTHFHDDYTMLVDNRADSYIAKDEEFKHSVLSYSTVGATSLFTTAEDMLLWAQSFQDNTVWGEDVIKAIHTKGLLNNGEEFPYALGVIVSQYRGLAMISHGGADAGYRSNLIRFPDQSLYIAVLCNLGSMNPTKLAQNIADIYLEDEFIEESSEEVGNIDLKPEQIANKIGIYYNKIIAQTIRIEEHNQKLMVMIGTGIPLVPMSENDFHLAPFPEMKFRFEQSNDGIQRLIQMLPLTSPVEFNQMSSISPSIDDLESYTGTYHSPELEVSFYLVMQDDQLCLRRRKHGTTALLATFTDGFIGNLYPSSPYGEGRLNLIFYRDNDNHIKGFNASGGRVRHVRFIRQKS